MRSRVVVLSVLAMLAVLAFLGYIYFLFITLLLLFLLFHMYQSFGDLLHSSRCTTWSFQGSGNYFWYYFVSLINVFDQTNTLLFSWQSAPGAPISDSDVGTGDSERDCDSSDGGFQRLMRQPATQRPGSAGPSYGSTGSSRLQYR